MKPINLESKNILKSIINEKFHIDTGSCMATFEIKALDGDDNRVISVTFFLKNKKNKKKQFQQILFFEINSNYFPVYFTDEERYFEQKIMQFSNVHFDERIQNEYVLFANVLMKKIKYMLHTFT